MNGSESKLNRVSPALSGAQLKHEPSSPPTYKSNEKTMVATMPSMSQIPVGNWAVETWQPPLSSDKCPLPAINRSMPTCDTYEPTTTAL